MKFREDRPFAGVDAAVKKLLEIANGLEPDHAGRIHIGAINALFMTAGGNPPEYSAAVIIVGEREPAPRATFEFTVSTHPDIAS
jgi:hypothetical protein